MVSFYCINLKGNSKRILTNLYKKMKGEKLGEKKEVRNGKKRNRKKSIRKRKNALALHACHRRAYNDRGVLTS